MGGGRFRCSIVRAVRQGGGACAPRAGACAPAGGGALLGLWSFSASPLPAGEEGRHSVSLHPKFHWRIFHSGPCESGGVCQAVSNGSRLGETQASICRGENEVQSPSQKSSKL